MRIPEWVRDVFSFVRYQREVKEAEAARDAEIRRFKAEVEQSRQVDTIITGLTLNSQRGDLIKPAHNRRSTDAR